MAVAIALAGVLLATRSAARQRGFLEDLARARIDRRITPRLSIGAGYRPCPEQLRGDAAIPRTSCDPDDRRSPSLNALLARVTSAAAQGDANAGHAAALSDMLWSDSAGAALDRSIATLSAAEPVRSPSVLSDVAAAYLVRAQQRQSMHDLLMALDAAEQSLERAPRYAPALFNRALALDWLNLVDQARSGWRAYLAVDSTSGWAAEAARRARALEWEHPRVAPAPSASAGEIGGYVRELPQEARKVGWERVLGRWGDAVVDGDAALAGRMLGLAGALGEALERRGADSTLAGAVRAIHRARGSALLSLARDHRAYAAGRAAYDSAKYKAARDTFSRILRRPGAASPLYAWTRVFRAGAVGYLRPEAAEGLAHEALEEIIASPPGIRGGALEGRARWIVGTLLLRQGEYPGALAEFRAAQALFARTGETENLGATFYLQGETLQRQGETEAGYAALQRAGLILRPYRRSVWLHDLLLIAAEGASASGARRAAHRLVDEDVAVSGRIDLRIYLAEARLRRARLRGVDGDTARVSAELAAVRGIVARLDTGYIRGWFTTELGLVAAAADVHGEPARTRARLDSAVAFWRGRRNTTHQLPAFLAHARAALVLGDVSTARSDLRQAVAMVERIAAAEPLAMGRARLLDVSHVAFDQLAMLSLKMRDTTGALEVVERGRPSFIPHPARAAAPIPAVLPDVAVSYAVVGDTLRIWTVSRGRSVALSNVVWRPQALAETISRVRTALERQDDGPELEAGLDSLYDRLVRPVEGRLGPAGAPLLIVADGIVASVPFAALRDSRRGRYLVEDHPLRFAASLRDAAAPGIRTTGTERPPLLVADPAFDRRAHPGFERLPGAAAEVRALGALYPGAPVLAGTAASRGALEAGLRGAGLLHYAGHAVADDAQPDASFLLLARGAAGEDRFTAAEIERLDLRGVRLVVLSACETQRAGLGRSGGFAGLSGAFLSAGSGGVVGSLWRIDDGSAVAVMTAFHRAYHGSADAARALRDAQVQLIRSPDPWLRSPAAWAAFRYAGR
ncbi:CHAT domain-containing protein [bacterium JGI 053]|nr:CHAT domain-containing protein [bacterium JGI 053]